jgi:hypothetical protein
MFSRSLDAGRTWVAPIDVSPRGDDQFFPWIVGTYGSSASWIRSYDERWNAGLLDVGCSRTANGRMFDPPVTVSC